MTHQMNLNQTPFELISSGKKVVEMRLKTPKRDQIKVDDTIVFTSEGTDKKLEVLVLNIESFPSFKELYESVGNHLLGYPSGQGNYEDMYEYYTKEDIDKYGVLAIYIKVISF